MTPLHALLVEDSALDAALIVRELERHEFKVNFTRVENADALRSAMVAERWDIILCDNAMPQFDATAALRILSETGLDIPFIIVSGEIGEDLAVACMKAGAHDYIMKGRLARLAPAVRRELRDAETRRESRRIEGARRKAEEERAELLVAEQAARADAERLCREANRANRLKDQFLATLSHELRTPLNAILGWAEILRNHEVEPAGLDQAVEVIYRNAKAQSALIDDLLDVSRIISGKLELHGEAVDLGAVASAVEESFKIATKAKKLAMTVGVDGKATVYGDRKRLEQVVWNLVSNAVKFTPVGGSIVLTVRTRESKIELLVEDSGEGIDADFLPFVFDRFRQEDALPTRVHGGLGIGLGIAREIVAAHGGDIEAHSRGKGQGATFVVRIPVLPVFPVDLGAPRARAQPVVGLVGAQIHDERILEGISVLVVEDSDDSRLLVKLVLEQFGARVTGVASAQKGLDEVKVEKPDVVLCDISMPEMDGYEFIKALRNDQAHLGHIPVAAFTSYAGAEDRNRAIACGFEEHIAKPVATYHLIEMVAKLCHREPHA